MTPEERREALRAHATRQQAAGDNVIADNGLEVIMGYGKRPNHILHLILSLLTLGLWAIVVWLPLGLFGGEKRYVLRVDDHGRVIRSRP